MKVVHLSTLLLLVFGCGAGVAAGVDEIPSSPTNSEESREPMTRHEKINYLEFPACDLEATKAFFESAFGWAFVDYGPDYTSFSDQGLDGGFFKSDLAASTDKGSALVVLYSDDLEATLAKVEGAGGRVVKPIFSFPGGRRFHFVEPSGNELAVWTEGE